MRKLLTIFRHSGLDLHQPTLYRKAYRAIIFHDDLVLFIKSQKYGEYKFPGGGKNDAERALAVLKREVREETGYTIYSKIIPFGLTMEYAKDFEGKYAVFQQESRYYFCSVHKNIQPLALESYEIEYGYFPCWVTLQNAIENNQKLLSNDRIPWKERDTEVMILLANERKSS
ncbi:MAG: NUDIX domain-containing protein [Candidatus Izemoplasmatales bacterium]|nr:NUDIX domain-containing protein [Candidatus Izemoplasmatales bacterium]MDD3865024.1 NUDIX domain-containing protein [Candidatus Izemoplasmatales bacterium]